MSNCLQYYYENPEDEAKYKISCDNKTFEDLGSIENFNNKNLLDFIRREYSSSAFKEESPFEFQEKYINLTNEDICKTTDLSLAPQQKFMGHLMGPNSNFNNVLIYHGLGSGKSCTSIVIGEALKNSSNQRLLYVVPAPLVDQYYEEIAGEIRNGKFFSCPSFCMSKQSGGNAFSRDFYVSQPQNSILINKQRALDNEMNKLYDIEKLINSGNNTPAIEKNFKDQENKVNVLKRDLTNFQKTIRGSILRTFEIVTHQTFIESIYKTGASGQLIKNKRLLEDSALFHKNGLLIIDEIQRLVSAGGIFYKKLYNAIKYYFHPKLRIALLSATPIYDNPYELGLTINLLRPRVPFPIDKTKFYKYFIGKYNESNECVESDDDWVSEDSCILNKDLISYICSGYVSYFKGGNPNAYPYKRIISMEHFFSLPHKSEYISALKSDVSKDNKIPGKKSINSYENVLLGNYDTAASDDNVSGMYVTTQQYSNIFLPKAGTEINKTIAEKKQALEIFRRTLKSQNFKDKTEVINYIKNISTKFASIVELTLMCKGPVFIFSNWLSYGVEPLSIILEACGLSSFDKEDKGAGRYFIWSSETKTKDKDGTLIKKARNTFNSLENSDGSLLKVILGTRSVMEGVSFKNVRQVHITEPWWNESRIEQILARASRFCSHSNLPLEEQYVDIYRHYSVLSGPGGEKDPDVINMFKENDINYDFKNLATFGIDQKILMTSVKKKAINTDLNILLKNCSIDVEINKNGNLLRLEENVIPTSTGNYQIYYKNPSNEKIYVRDGIPETVSFNDVYNRVYSFPNKEFPIKFTEAAPNDLGIFKPYDDNPEIIQEPVINKDLIIKEELIPWNSEKTYKDLDISEEIKISVYNLYKNYSLIPDIRKVIFNESGGDIIKFKENPNKNIQLIKCIKQLSSLDIVPEQTKKKISNFFQTDTKKQKINEKVLEIVYKHKLYPESYLEELLNIASTNPSFIDDILKNINQ